MSNLGAVNVLYYYFLKQNKKQKTLEVQLMGMNPQHYSQCAGPRLQTLMVKRLQNLRGRLSSLNALFC